MDSVKITSVNCNHCGATLEVDEKTRFVTCGYCQSRLVIQRTASAVFTEVLEKIEEQTGQIADNLKVIQMQNDLERLDREWAMSRENLMVSGQNGSRREPSIFGGVFVILIGVIGGGAWTLFAGTMGAPWFFVLFGFFFIGVTVVGGIASINKAGKLDSTRSDYEFQRRRLVAGIETEKRRR